MTLSTLGETGAVVEGPSYFTTAGCCALTNIEKKQQQKDAIQKVGKNFTIVRMGKSENSENKNSKISDTLN